ncbi:hypothetical protein BKA65DRAFT_472734 [Rhexocercosporidium sp. MPI-PUGE-AT-0058]|nr:hypothetical protein BKA65DRAFT_472734 [Rhexocercosporidium sp. MPI-PUGE-AT-0058]
MSLPPAYTSQPPIISNLPANASNQSLSSLPPYSSQLPPNHVTVPHPYVGAVVPNAPRQVNPEPQLPPHPQMVHQVQAITPPTMIPQNIIPGSYPQMIQPQPQVAQPLLYCLVNCIPSGPVLATGPVYSSISYPYALYPPPYLQVRPQIIPPYILVYPSYQPQVLGPFQSPFQAQLQIQHPVHQPPLTTHQGGIFQEHGYPGPGSLPAGGRWAMTTDDGKRTLWTIMPGETRPSGWAYPGDAR